MRGLLEILKRPVAGLVFRQPSAQLSPQGAPQPLVRPVAQVALRSGTARLGSLAQIFLSTFGTSAAGQSLLSAVIRVFAGVRATIGGTTSLVGPPLRELG